MSALSQLLDRLRRLRPPPGAAAGVLAVPSAGDELTGEVAFVFDELDEIEREGELILADARADAAEIEALAERQRASLLEAARRDGARSAAELLAERRARCARLAGELVAEAEHEAARVLASGRARTPAFAEQVLARLLDGGR